MNDYSYSYGTTSSSMGGSDVALAGGIVLLMIFVAMIIAVGVYILFSIFLAKIFKKAGVASWKAWVPFLNAWKILELGGQQGYWIFINFIPFVGSTIFLVMQIIAAHNINKKIGYDTGMTVLFVLIPIVWVIVAANNDQPWNDSLGAPRLDQPDFAPATADQATVPPQPPAQPQPAVPRSDEPSAPQETTQTQSDSDDSSKDTTSTTTEEN